MTLRNKLTLFTILVNFMLSTASSAQVYNVRNMKIQGKVKRVTEKYFLPEKNLNEIEMKELLSKKIFTFYENGSLRAEIDFKGGITQYNYSMDGQLISAYYDFNDEGIYQIIDSFAYNSSRILSKRSIYKLDNNNEYGPKGTWHPFSIYSYNYSEYGDLTSIDHIYNTGNYYEPCVTCNDLTSLTISKYREDYYEKMEEANNLWESIPSEDNISKRIDLPDRTRETRYRYSESKNQIKLEYIYDTNKNWTKCTIFAGSKPFRIIVREITYY